MRVAIWWMLTWMASMVGCVADSSEPTSMDEKCTWWLIPDGEEPCFYEEASPPAPRPTYPECSGSSTTNVDYAAACSWFCCGRSSCPPSCETTCVADCAQQCVDFAAEPDVRQSSFEDAYEGGYDSWREKQTRCGFTGA